MASAHSPNLSAASSNITGGAPPSPSSSRSRECSKTPESASGCRSPGSPIGEDSCPICLGAFTDKCAAGSCLHNFCLVCLKEWSKQRPVCPLCKQSFSKILYDIKSETDYKEWKVPILYPNDLNDLEFRGFRQFFDTYGRRFFGYRSTFPRLIRRRAPASSLRNNSILGETNRQQRNFDRGSSLFRLSIYSNNLWVLPLSDITGRYRESSPQLYREQPALTHRLVPWVNRELAALISSSRIGVVLSLIMDLIERHPIDSSEFRQAIRPHLGVWTSHFAHEFYNFARSPYDMVGHDNASQYLPSYDRVRESADESGDDDDIIEVEPEPLDLSSRVAREETIGNDGSVFISSDSDSSLIVQGDNDLEAIYTERSTYPFSNRESRNSSLETHIPNYDRIPLPSELGGPGPSGVSSSNSTSIKRERSGRENCSDSDDCLVVDILKPKNERTPELIQLSSEPDFEEQEKEARNKNSSKIHWKKRKLEARNNSKNNHKRPCLDRTSFSLHVTGTLNCQRGEDHTYCTESASPCNPSSTRTESEEEDDIEKDPDYESKGTLRDRVQRLRWNQVDSDSDSNIGVTVTSSYKETGSNKQRYQRKSCNKSSSSVSYSHSSVQKSRKDQKHKVKSSMRPSSSSAIPEASSSYHLSKRKRDSPSRSRKDLNCNHKRTRHYSSSSSSTSSFSSSSSSSSSSCSSFSCTSSSSTNNSSKHTKKSTSFKHRPRYGERKTVSSNYCEWSFSSDTDEHRSTSRSKSRSKLSKKSSRSSQREKYKKGKTPVSKSSSRSRDKRSSKKHKK